MADSLALALITSFATPLLLLDENLAVVTASASFCRNFEVDPAHVNGKTLFALGNGEWDLPRLRSLLGATLSGGAEVDAYEMDLAGRPEPRLLVLHAKRLEATPGEVRVLLAIADVTEARRNERVKDDLVREKAILLRELQHRVANSLQIIASVILQSARKVQSDETRLHLQDAHHRVMSVAAMQQQLAATSLEAVQLRPYFNQLCESISASMIRDHDQLTITVHVDDTSISPDESVSLGLIVTELVINSLKHAFPDSRAGVIKVDYKAHGPNWTLAVCDDGVGMPNDEASQTPGLGTSIVNALAQQLHAQVKVSRLHPGTEVTVSHTQIAIVDTGALDRAADHSV